MNLIPAIGLGIMVSAILAILPGIFVAMEANKFTKCWFVIAILLIGVATTLLSLKK